MNVNIYIDNNLARQVDSYIKANGISRSQAVREALALWLEKKQDNKWQKGFFNFEALNDFPNKEELRLGLKDKDIDPLQ